MLSVRYVFADISSEQAVLQNMIHICILVGVIAFGAFLLLSMALARWAVKPVEKAWQQQRQFVADASHELKTPLTVIMTNAELLSDPDSLPQQQGQLAQNILTMSRQMRRLVEGLLELARVDNGAVQKAFEPVALSTLVEDAILPFEPVYFERGLSVKTRIQEGLTVQGSGEHLKQVVEILLDNAMKYSDEGAVWVTLQRQGNAILLKVANPGEAMDEESCRKIFERFYRLDAARSMDGSYGLGLSIAKSIVEDHRGKIWAESKNGWNIFTVQLPA